MGRGGGQVVSVLAFYSDDPSSNPADAYSFSVQIVFEKNENKQKEAWVGPFFKNFQKLPNLATLVVTYRVIFTHWTEMLCSNLTKHSF